MCFCFCFVVIVVVVVVVLGEGWGDWACRWLLFVCLFDKKKCLFDVFTTNVFCLKGGRGPDKDSREGFPLKGMADFMLNLKDNFCV